MNNALASQVLYGYFGRVHKGMLDFDFRGLNEMKTWFLMGNNKYAASIKDFISLRVDCC